MLHAVSEIVKGIRKKVKSDYYDYSLLAIVILLICFGLIMLYSTSAYEADAKFGQDMYYFRKQALISVGAIVVAIIVSLMDYHKLIKWSLVIYIAAFILMLLVLSPLGVSVNGARRWLKLGVQFQPSEIAKIGIITYLPVLIIGYGKKITTRKGFAYLVGAGMLQTIGAYLFTDNLSTAMIIFGITFIMLFIAHPNTKLFVKFIIGAVIVVAVAVLYLSLTIDSSSSFRIRRVLVWLRPEEYTSAGGYQVMQGLYAIGSGGFFGKGLGNSVQKLGTIPEAQNDMIFSIICEELGVFGGILTLLMFAYLLYRLFFIAQNAPDLYGSLLATGIFAHIALQVILNICVVLNVIPTTGITLPFISYGGTSVVFLMLEMGLALSVSRSIRFGDEGS